MQLCSSQRAQVKMNNFSVIIAALVLVAVANAQPWGGQWQWPGSYGYGHSSTCFGCRGKRSAEPAYAGHPYGGTSYVGRTIWGFPGGYHHGYGKRSAEPEPYYGTGVAYHPYGGSSYVGRTVWGAWRGKRSAEPAYAHHPYGGSSYVGRTIWGFPGGYGYHG